MGTKLLNLYWIIALFPLLAFYLYINYPKIKLGRIFMFMGAMLLLMILLGSFSYIRTFLTTGNPFYPVKIVIFGKEIFPGFIDKDAFSNLFVRWSEFRIAKMFFSEGLGAQFILFILLATVIPVLAIPFIRKKYNFNVETIFLFFIPPIMFLLYFFILRPTGSGIFFLI